MSILYADKFKVFFRTVKLIRAFAYKIMVWLYGKGDGVMKVIEGVKAGEYSEFPEGGRYRYVAVSSKLVDYQHKGLWPALSHIYCQFKAGERAHLFRLLNDDMINLYRGEGIYLYLWKGAGHEVEKIEISAANNTFCWRVPGMVWQALEPIGEDVVVGRTLAPAFDFEEFEILREDSENSAIFLQEHGELEYLLGQDLYGREDYCPRLTDR